jgi:curved DNA-binding protein CbpA
MRRNPFAVLGLRPDASGDAIKAAWRRLAREHHPDVTSGDPGAERRATRTMAEINAAYQELRDPVKRRAHRAAAAREGGFAVPRETAPDSEGPEAESEPSFDRDGRSAPPRPVTARIDTSALLRPRNNILYPHERSPLPGWPPAPRSSFDREPPRASTPSGPTTRRVGPNLDSDLPSLAAAMDARLGFGKFAGLTLGDVVNTEPSYIEWIVRTIDRDPELTFAARTVLRELERSGRMRRPRLDTAVRRG